MTSSHASAWGVHSLRVFSTASLRLTLVIHRYMLAPIAIVRYYCVYGVLIY